MAHIAVVGAGPSGLFAAAELLRRPDLEVDVFDRLPTPFGLVRYGVAPDHLKIKSVTGVLSRVFTDPRARFFGNVAIGRVAGHTGATVGVAQLRAAYDAVLVATGAPHPRRLGLPGEDLPGSYAAGDLVSWYNGHPGAGVPYTTAADSVAVVGAGNVSLDIVRVLLKGGAGLAHTDAPVAVLDRLDRHPPREIHLIARRGPADVKFAQAELLELEKLSDVDVSVHPDDLRLDRADAARCSGDRTVAARVDTFRRWAAAPRRPGARRVHLRFRRTPVAILGDRAVTGLRLRRAGSGTTEDLPVQAVVRAIGYVGDPLPAVPFDHARGLVPNRSGRVARGLYAAGWVKRGPSGVIGANKACAAETVTTLLADLDAGALPSPERSRDELVADLTGSVTWRGWQEIDSAEIALGRRLGRDRTKITDLRRLFALGGGSSA